jgi:hypothetical protein
MTRKTRFLIALLAFLVLAPALCGDDRSDDKVKELMHRKLENAQKVLEGIALNDFDKITKHAEELMLVSKAVEWRVMKTPRFEIYTNEFRRAADSLIERAKDKNLDGAALSYVDLTLTCVRCHKYVRDTRMTRLGPDSGANLANLVKQ